MGLPEGKLLAYHPEEALCSGDVRDAAEEAALTRARALVEVRQAPLFLEDSAAASLSGRKPVTAWHLRKNREQLREHFQTSFISAMQIQSLPKQKGNPAHSVVQLKLLV